MYWIVILLHVHHMYIHMTPLSPQFMVHKYADGFVKKGELLREQIGNLSSILYRSI